MDKETIAKEIYSIREEFSKKAQKEFMYVKDLDRFIADWHIAKVEEEKKKAQIEIL